MERFLGLNEFEPEARRRLAPAVYEYVAGGAGDEHSIRAGGIRRGTDALKALLRGASAVLIGRPYLYALAIAGADGVARCLSLLIEEMRLAMGLVYQVRGWFSGVELKMSRRQGAEEEAYLNRYVTDEQRSRRLLFSSTPWAVQNWRFWRVARSTRMIHIRALRSRLPKSPILRPRR